MSTYAVKHHILPLLAYLALSIFLTWPLVVYFDRGFTGGSPGFKFDFEDAAQYAWYIWTASYAVRHGLNPYWTPLVYYPEGLQMYVQTLNLPLGLLTTPLNLAFGPIRTYNIAVLLTFTLTGYAGMLLAREFTRRPAVAFVCGALLTACPFHLMKLHDNHLNLLSLYPLPLYLLALIRLERGARLGVTGAALAAVLVILTDWYWALAAAIFTPAWMLASLAQNRARAPLLRRFVWFGLLTLLLLTPLFAGIAAARAQLPSPGNDAEDWFWSAKIASLDLLGFFAPPLLHPIWGADALRIFGLDRLPNGPGWWYVAPGWVLLSCALLGLRAGWRRLLPPALGGLAAWLLALGPSLQVALQDTGILLPYALVQPLLGVARRPSHIAAITITAMIPFAALGLERLLRGRSTRGRALLIGCALALLLFESWPPPRAVSLFSVPGFLTQLRAEGGAVIDLPYEWNETSRALRHQMVHEQPIVGGYVSRRPPYPTIYGPVFGPLTQLKDWSDITPDSPAALRRMQCYYRLRHVLVDTAVLDAGQAAQLNAALTRLADAEPQPVAVEAGIAWYRLPLPDAPCDPFVYTGAGWHALESAGERRWRWATDESTIWIVNPLQQPQAVVLRFEAESAEGARLLEIWLDTRRIAGWEAGRAIRRYAVALTLAPGENRVLLRAPTIWDARTRRNISVSVSRMDVYPAAP